MHVSKFVMIYSNSEMTRVCVCVFCVSFLIIVGTSSNDVDESQLVFFNNLIQQHNYQVSNCGAGDSGPDGVTAPPLRFHAACVLLLFI